MCIPDRIEDAHACLLSASPGVDVFFVFAVAFSQRVGSLAFDILYRCDISLTRVVIVRRQERIRNGELKQSAKRAPPLKPS